nr:hypothetical protein [Tanacetum cinerariifolium]
MTTNFEKLDKFEGHDFRRWQKKDALPFGNFKGCVCSDYPDARVVRGRYSGSNQTQSKLVMKQVNELLRILGQHGLKLDESISVSSVIDKLPPSWKDFKHSLKHGKKRGFKDNGGSSSNKKPKLAWWKCGKTGHFKKYCRSGNKKDNASASGSGKGSKDQSQDQCQNLIDSGATTHVYKDRCWFKTYEPVKDESVLYMSDDHFAHVHGNGSVVLELSSGKFITLFNVLYVPKLRKNLNSDPVLNKCGLKQVYESDKAVVRLPDPKRKILGENGIDCNFVGYVEHSNAYRFYVIEPNDYASINTSIESRDAIFDENRFSLILRLKDIMPNSDERSRDQIGSQYSYCYSIEEDPRTYNEVMQSRDVTFLKKVIDDEIGLIMENNTWVLSNLPSVDKTKKFLSLNFSMKDMGEADVILCFKIKRENKRILITQSHYIEIILKKFNREDCSPCHVEDSSSTSGWVFLLVGGAISWAFKKQTCITSYNIEYEFVALAATGKKAEWLRNLIHEILIWPKPIASISIYCDGAATLAKAYS